LSGEILNTNFADPSGIDPVSTLLPGQSGALSGDSSVSPVTVYITIPSTFPPIPQINIYNNYNCAVARVRLRGLSGDVASNTKFFFRLWSTQTADTDFAHPAPASARRQAVIPQRHWSAWETTPSPSSTLAISAPTPTTVLGGVNNQNIKLDIGDSKWELETDAWAKLTAAVAQVLGTV
jgi:hypothetical protein